MFVKVWGRRKAFRQCILILVVFVIVQSGAPWIAFGDTKQEEAVQSVHYSNAADYLTMNKGEKKKLTYTVSPHNAANKKVIFKSSKPSVVAVSQKGIIRAVKRGTADVIVTSKANSEKKDRLRVTVGTKVSAVQFTNVSTNYVYDKGSKKSLRAKVSPATASNKRVCWTSSKPSVATVSKKGVLRAIAKGTTYVTAKAADGSGKWRRCKITVGTRVHKISISGQNYVGKGGETIRLSAKVYPASASRKGVTWKSSNPAVAKVTGKGEVKAGELGTAVIRAIAKDGTKKTASMKVRTVMPKQGKHTMFVGHRGYRSIAPENTAVSFQAAIKHGFGGVECDVWETKGITQEDLQAAYRLAVDSGKSAKVSEPGALDIENNTEDKTEETIAAARVPENASALLKAEVQRMRIVQERLRKDKSAYKMRPGLMISHDENLSRMCGVNKRITKLTPMELAQYPVVWGSNIGKYGGALPIPSYEQYLDVFANNDALPFIEIKSRKPRDEHNAISDEAAMLLVDMLRKKGQDKAVFLSFNIDSLLKVVSAARMSEYQDLNLDFFYLTTSKDELDHQHMNFYDNLGITGVGTKYSRATADMIGRADDYGLKTAVWTVDTKTEAYRLSAIDKIDYIVSNKKVFQ